MVSSPPPTTNPVAQQAGEVIQQIEAILVPIAEAAIQKAVPALALPVIKQIVDAIEQGLADKLTALSETGVTFTIIDVQTGTEQSTISKALAELITAEQSGDLAAIATALKAYAAAQQGLVSDDGSEPPQQ